MSKIIDGLDLVDEITGQRIGYVNGKGEPKQEVYDSMSQFPGAAIFGKGSVWIAGAQYWCDGASISLAGGVLLTSSNTASQNTTIIQSALNIGGDVQINGHGTFLINDTLIIYKNTKLTLGKGVVLKLAPGTNKNMLRNANWGSTAKAISAISVTNPSIGGTLAVRATATIAAHGKSAGDFVHIHGVTPDLYNGIWEIETVPDANTITYLLAYDIGDSIANGAGTQVPYIQTSDTYTTNSVNSTAASTAVTGTGFVTGTAWQGKTIASVVNGVFTVIGVISTVNSSTSITLTAGASNTVTSGRFTILDPAAMWMRDADCNISIEGGEWDYDGLNQSTPDTYLRHGIYIRRCYNLQVKNLKFSNAQKYAIALGNIYTGLAENIDLDSFSDGVHWIGSGDNIVSRNITGKSGDDFVVIGQSDFWMYLDPQYVFGDFGYCRASGIKPRRSFSGFKYYGVSTNTITDLVVDDIGGAISGGSGVTLIINDQTSVGAEAGGSTVTKVSIDTAWDQSASKSGINIGGSGSITVDKLLIPNLNIGLGNTVGTSNAIFLSGSAIVNKLVAGNINVYAGSGSYSSNANCINIQSTAKLLRADISNMSLLNISYAINCQTPGLTDEQMIVNIGNLMADNCGTTVTASSRISINIGKFTRKGMQVQNAFVFADYSKLAIGQFVSANDGVSMLSIAATKTLTVRAPQFPIDPTAMGGGTFDPVSRNCSFFNVAATWGTVQQYNTVFFRPADSKWVQATNTTLTS